MKIASIFALIGGMTIASASTAQDMYAGEISCNGKETYGYVAETAKIGSEIQLTITQNEPRRQQSWKYTMPADPSGSVKVRVGKIRGNIRIDGDNIRFTNLAKGCVDNTLSKTTKQQVFDGFEKLQALNAVEVPTDENVAHWAELMLRRPPSLMFPPTEQGEVEAKLNSV